MTEPIDCAVIGGGPAGLVTALYLLRFRRSVLIADRGDSRAAYIPRSHNFPGFPDGIGGKDLLALLHQQVERYGRPAWGGEVLRVEKHDRIWRVVMQDSVCRARRIVFATGVTDRWPPMQNAKAAIDRGVLRFCPICDGFEAKDKRVAVIGDDDHAAREAMFLRTYSVSVSLLSDGRSLSPETRLTLTREGVALAAIQPESLRFERDAIWAADPAGAALAPFDVAYSALGNEPQTQLLATLGVTLDAGGCIGVDAHQQTSISGLYAAGDAVRGLDQLSVAAGEAAIAATAVHNSLRERDG